MSVITKGVADVSKLIAEPIIQPVATMSQSDVVCRNTSVCLSEMTEPYLPVHDRETSKHVMVHMNCVVHMKVSLQLHCCSCRQRCAKA